jgi:mono/diheme cytochrome c family protein
MQSRPGAPMTRLPLSLTLSVLSLAIACRDDAPDPGDGAADESSGPSGEEGSTSAPASETGVAATVTYYETIKPLLDARCVSCHREGGIAPMSLATYEDAAAWSGAAAAAIHAGTMPPWPPADGCNEYAATREMNDEEIALVDTWIAEQVPMGDPALEGAPLDDGDPGLTRVDLAMEMPEAYAMQQSPDDYRCFVIDWPAEYTTTKYVAGFRAVPGNDAIVHHVIAYLATPEQVDEYVALDEADPGAGYTCFGGSGGSSRTWLGGWAPGGAGADLPPGLGLEVPPGSKVVLQVHYNSMSSDPGEDVTGVEFKIEDEVEKVARVMPFANPAWLAGDGMLIPAGDDDVMHEFQRDISALLGGPQNVWAGALHMHTRGASGRLSIERAGGASDCVLEIDAWDFHWQGSYGLVEPMRLEEGDELRLECHFDNSAANQPVVDGVKMEPQDITWGEGTNDEMCLGVMLVAPA